MLIWNLNRFTMWWAFQGHEKCNFETKTIPRKGAKYMTDRMIPIRNFCPTDVPNQTDNKKEPWKGRFKATNGRSHVWEESPRFSNWLSVNPSGRYMMGLCTLEKHFAYQWTFLPSSSPQTSLAFFLNLCIPEMAFNGLFSDAEEGKKYLYFS